MRQVICPDIAHFYKSQEVRIETLLAPLQQAIDLELFIYSTFFLETNEAFFLSNCFPVADEIVQVGHFSEDFRLFLADTPRNGSLKKFLWSADSANESEIATILCQKGYAAGITYVYFVEKNILMNVSFAGVNHTPEFFNTLVNSDEPFNRFIKYFEAEMEDCLKKTRDYTVPFVTDAEVDLYPAPQKFKECYELMEPKKVLLSPYDEQKDSSYLTVREYECLDMLCQGQSIKQIAYNLSLSARTVESYLKTCKRKFDVFNKFDLVQKARYVVRRTV